MPQELDPQQQQQQQGRKPAQHLWNPDVRRFDGPRLRLAIISRGWTVSEFARAAKVDVASVNNAIRGNRLRDSTVIHMFEALQKREPMSVAQD
jgi:hypothetical protein